MPHLLNVWPSVSRRLAEAGRVLLLFDYDGTLTPIVPKPEDAVLSPRVRSLLAELAAKDGYLAGIVSGRSLADLRKRVAITGLVYAGNHGLEICGTDLDFVHPGVAASARTLEEAFGLLTASIARFPGATVEHKGASLTVHFRAVADAVAPRVDAAAEETVRPLAERNEVRITRGKKVLEIRPNIDWDKGKAIAMIRDSYPDQPLPVFFGDDRTDEDGFDVVQEQGGLAVFVGPPRVSTKAWHRLESPDEVAQVLELLRSG